MLRHLAVSTRAVTLTLLATPLLAQQREYVPQSAPALSADVLSTYPTSNWLTNGASPFGGALSQDDIQDVATYLVKELIPAAAP